MDLFSLPFISGSLSLPKEGPFPYGLPVGLNWPVAAGRASPTALPLPPGLVLWPCLLPCASSSAPLTLCWANSTHSSGRKWIYWFYLYIYYFIYINLYKLTGFLTTLIFCQLCEISKRSSEDQGKWRETAAEWKEEWGKRSDGVERAGHPFPR